MADLVLDQADEKMEDPLNAFCWAPNTKSIVLFSLAQFIENGFKKRIARNLSDHLKQIIRGPLPGYGSLGGPRQGAVGTPSFQQDTNAVLHQTVSHP